MAARNGLQGEGAAVPRAIFLPCGRGPPNGQGRHSELYPSIRSNLVVVLKACYKAKGVARPSLTSKAIVEGEVPDDIIAFTATQVYTGGADTVRPNC